MWHLYNDNKSSIIIYRVSQNNVYTLKLIVNVAFNYNFIISKAEKYFTSKILLFFTASQTDVHFDPDIADNTKQWNRTHHEIIPMGF